MSRQWLVLCIVHDPPVPRFCFISLAVSLLRSDDQRKFAPCDLSLFLFLCLAPVWKKYLAFAQPLGYAKKLESYHILDSEGTARERWSKVQKSVGEDDSRQKIRIVK